MNCMFVVFYFILKETYLDFCHDHSPVPEIFKAHLLQAVLFHISLRWEYTLEALFPLLPFKMNVTFFTMVVFKACHSACSIWDS